MLEWKTPRVERAAIDVFEIFSTLQLAKLLPIAPAEWQAAQSGNPANVWFIWLVSKFWMAV
jgi:hypothetical protein